RTRRQACCATPSPTTYIRFSRSRLMSKRRKKVVAFRPQKGRDARCTNPSTSQLQFMIMRIHAPVAPTPPQYITTAMHGKMRVHAPYCPYTLFHVDQTLSMKLAAAPVRTPSATSA
ncbi:unnamed protein product, partial [Ectocarpus sp. 12 AP-2014]